VAAANANMPTEMAIKLLQDWNARGYGLDVVLYRKYAASTWIDPHAEDKVAFKDLPNRFPSVLSRDFRREQDQYEDPDGERLRRRGIARQSRLDRGPEGSSR
jgi:hypothetical protein